MSSVQPCFGLLCREQCQQGKHIAGEPFRNCSSLLDTVKMSPGRKLKVSVCSRPCQSPACLSLPLTISLIPMASCCKHPPLNLKIFSECWNRLSPCIKQDQTAGKVNISRGAAPNQWWMGVDAETSLGIILKHVLHCLPGGASKTAPEWSTHPLKSSFHFLTHFLTALQQLLPGITSKINYLLSYSRVMSRTVLGKIQAKTLYTCKADISSGFATWVNKEVLYIILTCCLFFPEDSTSVKTACQICWQAAGRLQGRVFMILELVSVPHLSMRLVRKWKQTEALLQNPEVPWFSGDNALDWPLGRR